MARTLDPTWLAPSSLNTTLADPLADPLAPTQQGLADPRALTSDKDQTDDTTPAPVTAPDANNSSATVLSGTEYADWLSVLRHVDTSIQTFGGNDIVSLHGSADYVIDLGDGNDRLTIGGTGDVTAFGGKGRDTFHVQKLGDHTIDGGEGYDRLDFGDLGHGVYIDAWYEIATENYTTTAGTIEFDDIDSFIGSDFDDQILGSYGADNFDGGAGNDTLYGREGDDRIYGAEGDDIVHGGKGHDTAYGEGGADILYGESGDDWLFGQGGDDELRGQAGDDYLSGGTGDDNLYNSIGSDTVLGGSGADVVHAWSVGDSDNDTFHGGDGDDSVVTGDQSRADTLDYRNAPGSAYINAESGIVQGHAAGTPTVTQGGGFIIIAEYTDTISGFEQFIATQFDDTIRGTDDPSVDEWFYGYLGNDVFRGSLGNDHFYGDDLPTSDISGANALDTVDYRAFGGKVEVDLFAGTGTVHDYDSGASFTHTYDEIEGVVGSDYGDILAGNVEDNRFEGRGGFDALTGGAGDDTFVYDGAAGNFGYDLITDFSVDDDILELAGLSLADGTAVDSFAALDTNGDGVLSGTDAPMITSGDFSVLLFAEGYIGLHDVTALTADDFSFV